MLLTLMTARVSVKALIVSRERAGSNRTMVIVTFVPGSPRSFESTSLGRGFLSVSLLILTILSPAIRPARWAGDPTNGDTTVISRCLLMISSPRPPYIPLVSTSMFFASCGGRN